MFQPRGPNLRRSRTIAWKKERAKKSGYHTSYFLLATKKSFSVLTFNTLVKVRNTDVLMPFGGSEVSFDEFCSMVYGNPSIVIDVNHSRKLAFVSTSFDCGFFISELSSSQSSSLSYCDEAGLNLGYIFSIICSNSGRKLAER